MNQHQSEQLHVMQQEIIKKERRISELERKLRSREEDLERLKQERDRLVQISNDLRGELNIAQRRILELNEEALGGSGQD
jgi:chromosome segregation ATPase